MKDLENDFLEKPLSPAGSAILGGGGNIGRWGLGGGCVFEGFTWSLIPSSLFPVSH
jgi:hypothetical protein